MSGQEFFYGSGWVMRNRLNIRSKQDLELVEKKITALKAFSLPEKTEGLGFGLDRLKAIHKHLFEDLYEWAGQERNTDIKKFSNSQNFSHPSEFSEIFSDIESDLLESGWFDDDYTVSQDEFSSKIADIYTQVNAAHPFPEGNGRATREYLKAIGAEVGYNMDFDLTNPKNWYEASKKSFEGNKGPLKILFREISTENSMGVTAEMDGQEARDAKKFLSMFDLDMESQVPDFPSNNNQESSIIKNAKDRESTKKLNSDGPHP